MQGSTVVLIPSYGHMRDYLNSLEAIKEYSAHRIAPGHGYIMDNPVVVIDDKTEVPEPEE